MCVRYVFVYVLCLYLYIICMSLCLCTCLVFSLLVVLVVCGVWGDGGVAEARVVEVQREVVHQQPHQRQVPTHTTQRETEEGGSVQALTRDTG